MTKTIYKLYIPYTGKAINTLRKAQRQLSAVWTVDQDEIVTITVNTKRSNKLLKMLEPIKVQGKGV